MANLLEFFKQHVLNERKPVAWLANRKQNRHNSICIDVIIGGPQGEACVIYITDWMMALHDVITKSARDTKVVKKASCEGIRLQMNMD